MTNDKNPTKDTSAHIAEEADKAKDTIRSEADQLAREAKDSTRQQAEKQFEKGQDVIASQVDTLSSAMDDAASTLNEQDHPLGHYTREIADSMSGLSEKISNSSLDELANDTRRLARENPGLFMLGSIAIGVAASRFFKASADRDPRDYPGSDADQSQRYAPDYGRSTSVRSTPPHSGSHRYTASSRQQDREAEIRTRDSGAGATAPVAGSSVTEEKPRVNTPVSPTEKSVGNKPVKEPEGA
ncbi:hypothetical protein ACUNV4_19895 [Granulosicoccus sp. 3-233]|uniref:hypothetical protein n=1 Tax=Granulosicoccus sp. 3-233 TaxID=3417969 RepID=UPI003D3579A9